MLDNLLANAIRHAPPGGDVTVSVTNVDGALGCEVTDSGSGFPAEQLEWVFDRFSRSADSRGSGLGLSIARDLVHAHHGTIAASNHPATGGARVCMTLPHAHPDG